MLVWFWCALLGHEWTIVATAYSRGKPDIMDRFLKISPDAVELVETLLPVSTIREQCVSCGKSRTIRMLGKLDCLTGHVDRTGDD